MGRISRAAQVGVAQRVPKPPSPSSRAVSAAMRGNTRERTRPEMIVPRLLHQLGYRYRTQGATLPGRPDVVFTSRRRCSDPRVEQGCPLRSRPRSNTAYWHAKLDRNIERDSEHERALAELGWQVLTIWECECRDLNPNSDFRVKRWKGSCAYVDAHRNTRQNKTSGGASTESITPSLHRRKPGC